MVYIDHNQLIHVKPPETNRVILEGDAIYREFSYRSEKELESLAVKNRDALFGKSSIYFDIKKLITTNASISKVPDGLLLTCTSFHDSKIWLVEYELSTHDLERHIYPQVLGFIKALKNEPTKRRIKEIMYNHIKQNPDSVKKIKDTLPDGAEIYHFLEITLESNIGIVMVVEKKTPELEEIIDSISANMNLQSHILEFITYQNNKGKKIHLLDMLPVISIQPKKSQNAVVMTWDTRMERAAPKIKELVMKLKSDAKARLECVGTSWFKWYGFYVNEPVNRKKLFGVIILGKNTATLCFRVKEEEFKNGNDNVRYVKGFFFPAGTERRIHVQSSNVDQLLSYLRHVYEVTIQTQKQKIAK